jgi:hypothetical protein
MEEFEFASFGIKVGFAGSPLFLTPKMLADFEDRYVGRVSERTLQSMLVVTQNVSALSGHAEKLGRKAVLGTTTFMYDNEYMQQMGWSKCLVAELVKFRRAVRRLTGRECVWALERNGVNRRLHEQEVWSGYLELDKVEEAKKKALGIGRCNVKVGWDPFYLAKEMGKRVGCRGNGTRHFGAMGEFEGKCGMRDFLLRSPAGEIRRLVWATRDPGETAAHMWGVRGPEMYESWLSGFLSLGPEWDKYREACAAGYRKTHGPLGDAAELDGGDVSFDVEDFEQ